MDDNHSLERSISKQILLPSARHLEERLTVSQSASQPGKQSARQSVGQAGKQTGRQAETHSLAFFQLQTTITNIGDPLVRKNNQ